MTQRRPDIHMAIVIAVGFILLIFICSIGALIMLKSRGPGAVPAVVVENGDASPDPLAPDPRTSDLSIPPFSLTDQDGRAVTNDAFRGRLTIVDFFFTNCPFICPMLTERMSELSGKLEKTGVRFMSITVDPEHDTPEHLKEYGAVHNADFSRWSFLTGTRETVWSLLSEKGGLQWAIEERAEQPIMLPDGARMSNIRHPGWFVLVGPEGEVLGIYRADEQKDMEALEARTRAGDTRLPKSSK